MRICCFLYLVLFLFSCTGKDNSLKIKGSDTEVNLAVELAEKFYSENKDYSLAVSGGGSGLGIASLYNGQADIANSSRPLSADEIKLFENKGVKLITNIFAEDATAIVINSQLPINEIDSITLSKIFNGTIKNWKVIAGKDLPITIYGRQSNSGTHSFVQSKLGIKFSNEAKEMNGNAQILEGIKVDPSGIGYVGAGYLLNISRNSNVKVLSVKTNENNMAVSPLNQQAIQNRQYFFQRPLYQFIPATSWKRAKPFIDFEKSEAGKNIIRNSGYYVLD